MVKINEKINNLNLTLCYNEIVHKSECGKIIQKGVS